MQSSMAVAGMDALSESCENILTRRANQRHYSIMRNLQNAHGPVRQRALLARLQAKNPYPQLKLHRLAEVASARHSEGSPLALPSRARFPSRLSRGKTGTHPSGRGPRGSRSHPHTPTLHGVVFDIFARGMLFRIMLLARKPF